MGQLPQYTIVMVSIVSLVKQLMGQMPNRAEGVAKQSIRTSISMKSAPTANRVRVPGFNSFLLRDRLVPRQLLFQLVKPTQDNIDHGRRRNLFVLFDHQETAAICSDIVAKGFGIQRQLGASLRSGRSDFQVRSSSHQ